MYIKATFNIVFFLFAIKQRQLMDKLYFFTKTAKQNTIA